HGVGAARRLRRGGARARTEPFGGARPATLSAARARRFRAARSRDPARSRGGGFARTLADEILPASLKVREGEAPRAAPRAVEPREGRAPDGSGRGRARRRGLARAAAGRRLHAEGLLDSADAHPLLLVRLLLRGARARRAPLADGLEPARGAARGRLL